MPRRRRLSLEQHTEDRDTAAGLSCIVTALAARHPSDVGLGMALRGLREFAGSAPAVSPRKRTPAKPKAAQAEPMPLLPTGGVQ